MSVDSDYTALTEVAGPDEARAMLEAMSIKRVRALADQVGTDAEGLARQECIAAVMDDLGHGPAAGPDPMAGFLSGFLTADEDEDEGTPAPWGGLTPPPPAPLRAPQFLYGFLTR